MADHPQQSQTPPQQPLCLRHQEKIDRLDHEVFGNGKPGLRSMINEINIKTATAVTVLKGVFAVLAATLLPVGLYFVTRLLELLSGR